VLRLARREGRSSGRLLFCSKEAREQVPSVLIMVGLTGVSVGDSLQRVALAAVASCSHLATGLAGDGQEELELGWQLVLRVQPVGEVDSTDTAVGVDLNSEGLNVVGTVGSTSEIGQVELDLVPALVESHGHGADEGLDTRGGLVVGGSESATHVLVIEDLHLESEVLLQVLDDHDEEGKLDGKGLLGVTGARDVVGRDVGAHDLEDGGLDVCIGQSLDVAVPDGLVPNLEGLGTDGVEDGEES